MVHLEHSICLPKRWLRCPPQSLLSSGGVHPAYSRAQVSRPSRPECSLCSEHNERGQLLIEGFCRDRKLTARTWPVGQEEKRYVSQVKNAMTLKIASKFLCHWLYAWSLVTCSIRGMTSENVQSENVQPEKVHSAESSTISHFTIKCGSARTTTSYTKSSLLQPSCCRTVTRH